MTTDPPDIERMQQRLDLMTDRAERYGRALIARDAAWREAVERLVGQCRDSGDLPTPKQAAAICALDVDRAIAEHGDDSWKRMTADGTWDPR